MITVSISRAEINEAVGKFNALIDKKLTDEELKKSFTVGAKVSERAIKAAAPVASVPVVKRYSTPKLFGRLKAPKGQGKVIATYHRGNLRNAMRILNLKRAKGVYIGAYSRGSKQGIFKGARADGYYLHMIENGTKYSPPKPFVSRAFEASKGEALAQITADLKRKIEG